MIIRWVSILLLVSTTDARADDRAACEALLARTAHVGFGEFVGGIWKAKNIHALVDRLEVAHDARNFVVPLGRRGRRLWILQEKDLIQSVMRSPSRLPFVNRNFDASHGHFHSINSVDTTDPLWTDLHHEMADIFKTVSIVPNLEKHRAVLLGADRFNLNRTLEEFYLKVWGEYVFGEVEYASFKTTRDRLIAVLGKVFHQNPVNRLPWLGAATSRLNYLRHAKELRAVDDELNALLARTIARREGAFYELFRRLEPKYPNAFEIVRDNSFLAILVYDFIHIVMLDTLAHVAQSPEIDRQAQLLTSRHHAFLYPFRFRVVEEDHEGFRHGDFVVLNLVKSGLYFSAGARFCPGAGVFKALSRWTLDALAQYDLRLVDPSQKIVRSDNLDLPFMLSEHEVVMQPKCPHAEE